MMRILGFLVGLAAVAAPLAVWLVGTGRLDGALPPGAAQVVAAPAPGDGPAAPSVPPAPVTPAPEPATPEPPGPEPSAEPPAEPPDPGPAPAEPATAGEEAEDEATGEPATAGAPVPDEAGPAPDTGPAPAEAVVWQPFRSERAARGFADHLAERYGADCRVRREAPGRYRVLVTAASEAELEATLARLRGATGLARLEARP